MSSELDNFDPNIPLDKQEFDDPNEELFFAIAWCDRSGFIDGDFLAKIKKACTDGANLNGFSEDGETPLTASILGGMGAANAVEALLDLGADPSIKDKNGYTPWSACLSRIKDKVVMDEMLKIKSLLSKFQADQSDEKLLEFQHLVEKQELEKVKELIATGINLHSLIIGPLEIAVRNLDIEMVKLLLLSGVNVEGNNIDPESETCLMTAAGLGKLELVKILVNAGADSTRYAWDDKQCTADFLAREAGHEEVADWLVQQLPSSIKQERKDKIKNMNPKFKEIYKKQTNGINCEITNDDIIIKLNQWDKLYEINISNVEHDGFTIEFENLPNDLIALANEIYEFCPDIIDQGYGCMEDMVEMAEEYGHEIPAESLKLIEGIDFSDENYGLKILQKVLKETKEMGFWWD